MLPRQGTTTTKTKTNSSSLLLATLDSLDLNATEVVDNVKSKTNPAGTGTGTRTGKIYPNVNLGFGELGLGLGVEVHEDEEKKKKSSLQRLRNVDGNLQVVQSVIETNTTDTTSIPIPIQPTTKTSSIQTQLQFSRKVHSESSRGGQLQLQPPPPPPPQVQVPKRVNKTRSSGSEKSSTSSSSLSISKSKSTSTSSTHTSTSTVISIPSSTATPFSSKSSKSSNSTIPSSNLGQLLENINEPPSLIRETSSSTESTVLPNYSYKDYTSPKPFVIYTKNEEETNEFIDYLNPGPVAMDLEWKVLFYKKHGNNIQLERRTAVIQIADTKGVILIIQLTEMKRFPIRLQALIENPDIPKVGVNILNDGKKLLRDFGIISKNLVELGSLACIVDPSPPAKRKIISLAKLVEHYCGKILLKGPERMSDWEKPLTEEQREYAANDAHSSLMVYNELLQLSQLHFETRPLTEDIQHKYVNDVSWSHSTSTSSAAAATDIVNSGLGLGNTNIEQEIRPQHLRAYDCWYNKKLSLEQMCKQLSLKSKGYGVGTGSSALKPGTVITYVISALQLKPELKYDIHEVVKLVQMDIGSWSRHCSWIINQLLRM